MIYFLGAYKDIEFQVYYFFHYVDSIHRLPAYSFADKKPNISLIISTSINYLFYVIGSL